MELERALLELAQRIDIADADWLADDVLRQLSEPPPRRQPRVAVAWVAVAVCVTVLAVVAVLPGPRHAVARWLGFDSVSIEPGVTTPTTAPTPPTSPTGSTAGAPTTTLFTPPDIDLGAEVSLAEAMATTGLPDPTPKLLGRAQSVHVLRPPDSGQIMLLYAPSATTPQSAVTGVGALVSVMPARLDEGMFRKMLGETATAQSVDVGGDQGFWIEGKPHQLVFEFNDGTFDQDTLRLATNTLIWQHGDLVYRLEADIDLSTALLIARSI